MIIIGAGFGGIGLGIRLKASRTEFLILERSDSVGGVWRDNRYPGAACDIPSHLYSFSFEPWPDWPAKYANQADILNYLVHCARKHGLEPHIRFGAEVTAARWDDAAGHWIVDTHDGQVFEAQALVSATGQLSRPAMPQVPGLESFAGPAFHSARWPQTLDLDGKHVAVVGTGASAIQIVPAIAPHAGKVHLFQRSAAYVLPKPDRVYACWQRLLFRYLPGALSLSRLIQYIQHEVRAIAFVVYPRALNAPRALFKRHLRRSVQDPALRRRLTPDYPMGCKRILLSNDYFQALARPNVELVTEAIGEVRADSIVTADGVERRIDCIVFGTGFTATDFLAPIAITGLAGQDLRQTWKDGAEAYLGITVAGFPNFFMLYGPNTNLGHNSIVYMLESQIRYVMKCLKRLRRGARSISVKPEAQARFNADMHKRMARTVWASGCTAWYFTAAGRNTANWPGFTLTYRHRTRAPDWSDYAIR